MSLLQKYIVKQVENDGTLGSLLDNAMLGEYCRKNYLNIYGNKDTAKAELNKITNEHVINDEVYTLTFNIYTTVIYVNRNNYFMIFSEYTKNSNASGSLQTTDSKGWFIFQDIQYSGINAYILDSNNDPTTILSNSWTIPGSSSRFLIIHNFISYPNYPKIRTWTRWTPPCVRCSDVNLQCTNNPSKADLDMRRKAQTLLHINNSANLSKKVLLSNRIKKANASRKSYWATQSATFTDPNVNKLFRINNTLLLKPPGFSIENSDLANIPGLAENVKTIIEGNYCMKVTNVEIQQIKNSVSSISENNIYFPFKNSKNSYLISTDYIKSHPNSTIKLAMLIYFFNGIPNIVAKAQYSITKQKYSSLDWNISKNVSVKLVSDYQCNKDCVVPSFSPVFSNVPGKGPNLYLDKSVPLTQYILRRTFKGTF